MNEDFQLGAKAKQNDTLDPDPLPQNPIPPRRESSFWKCVCGICVVSIVGLIFYNHYVPGAEQLLAFVACGLGVVFAISVAVILIQNTFGPDSFVVRGTKEGKVIDYRISSLSGTFTVDTAKELAKKLNDAIEESETE